MLAEGQNDRGNDVGEDVDRCWAPSHLKLKIIGFVPHVSTSLLRYRVYTVYNRLLTGCDRIPYSLPENLHVYNTVGALAASTTRVDRP